MNCWEISIIQRSLYQIYLRGDMVKYYGIKEKLKKEEILYRYSKTRAKITGKRQGYRQKEKAEEGAAKKRRSSLRKWSIYPCYESLESSRCFSVLPHKLYNICLSFYCYKALISPELLLLDDAVRFSETTQCHSSFPSI